MKNYYLSEQPTALTAVEMHGVSQSDSSRIAVALSAFIFWSLLGLLPLTAIPYGAVEPWWKAVFQCLVFLLTGLWLLDYVFFSGAKRATGVSILLPFVALLIFASLQTISWGAIPDPSTNIRLGHALSFDPFGTRQFVLHLTALVLAGWLLFQYVTQERRLVLLCHALIAIAVLSALFGMYRQGAQAGASGFFLSHLRPGEGYAQFINRNHFAYLMEMAMGLTLGQLLGAGRQVGSRLIYLASYLLMGATVVLSSSRGGMLSIVCQLLLAGMFYHQARLRWSMPGRQSLRHDSIKRRVVSLMGRGLLGATLLLILALGVTWVGGDKLVKRVDELAASEVDETRDNTSRYDIWLTTLDMIKDHPISGVGFGGYWMAVPQYHDASGRLAPQEAHNDYLELLASGGLIGFAIALWGAFVVGRRARRCLVKSRGQRRAICFGAMLGLCAVGLHSLTDFGLHITVNALAFVALIVLACRELPQRRRSVLAGEEMAVGNQNLIRE